MLARYPAGLSLTAYSYTSGVLFVVLTSFLVTNGSTDWNLTQSEVFAVLYAVSFSSLISLFWYVENVVKKHHRTDYFLSSSKQMKVAECLKIPFFLENGRFLMLHVGLQGLHLSVKHHKLMCCFS